MDYSKLNQQLLLLTILIVITVFFIYTRSFTNDIPSCNGYITNVYLYLLLGLLITAFSILFIAKRRYPITSTKSLLFFAIAIISLFTLFMVNPSNVLLNHAVWLAFILSFSISVYTIWRYSEYRGIFTNSLIITFLLTAGLTIVAYVKPDWIKLSWGSVLTIALLIGLLAWIVPIFFANVNEMRNYYKFLSAIFIFIFMMLILYDTKMLRIKAEQCTVPDYPKDSLGLFLDIINLFSNVVMLR